MKGCILIAQAGYIIVTTPPDTASSVLLQKSGPQVIPACGQGLGFGVGPGTMTNTVTRMGFSTTRSAAAYVERLRLPAPPNNRVQKEGMETLLLPSNNKTESNGKEDGQRTGNCIHILDLYAGLWAAFPSLALHVLTANICC